MTILTIIGIITIVLCLCLVFTDDKPVCNHKWKCIHQIKHNVYDEPWDKYPSERYMEKVWECENCKEIKHTYYDL